MKSVQFHNVLSIAITNIDNYTSPSAGAPFYHRVLTITMEDGSKEEFGLFSDNGYNMLIVDADLDSLTTELPLLKAA